MSIDYTIDCAALVLPDNLTGDTNFIDRATNAAILQSPTRSSHA
jgi:hypothetical protein